MSNVNKPDAGKASGSGNENSNQVAIDSQVHWNNAQDYRMRVAAADLALAQKDWQGSSAYFVFGYNLIVFESGC